jgi:Flp pilus assembly pilin Flp
MEHIRNFLRWLRVWLGIKRRAAGQGLVEYALILVLIAVIVVGALGLVGKQAERRISNVNCEVNAAGTGQRNCP